MGCDCSEQEESSGTHALVYTIGTEATFYRMIEATVPKDAACGVPIVHYNGTIEFPVDVPDIEGYERIGPRSFRPAWPNCQWRVLLTRYPDGYLAIQGQCHHALSDLYLEGVTPKQCRDCPQRAPIPSCHV